MTKASLILCCLSFAFTTSGQQARSAYLTLAGSVTGFKELNDSYGATVVFNLRLTNVAAVGVGATATRLNGKRTGGLTPLFGNLSFFIMQGKKGILMLEGQAGTAIYKKERISTNATSSIRMISSSGLYYSPGIGFYLKASKSITPFMKLAYVNYAFKDETIFTKYSNPTSPQEQSMLTQKSTLPGLQLSVGVKLF